ncbi:MAG: bifunctional oligoribonuclease/PAP phosphatase NrnA [Actinobacteria bacterium]|nr:MAG: bifunctional oligoribonuclease/PAP phosphatase NrnA [Actinomycetota bacterium]
MGRELGLEAAAAAMRSAQRIGVAGHVGPDGDALGSMLAIAHAARAAGKEAWASFGEPFVLPALFDFLDTTPLVSPRDLPDDLDLFVVVDTGVPERLGSLLPKARSARRVLVIDHHPITGDFGDVALVDPLAAATTQLVFSLIEALQWKVDKTVAVALYTGLVTDTGRFQYSSTSPATHRIAAALLAAGVEPDLIGRRLYEEAPFAYYTVISRVMGRAVLDAEHRLVWSVLTQDDLDAAGIAYEETDSLIDLVRIAEESAVCCLLKEMESGVIKGSLRSRGEVDVAAIAAELGGGGHHNAAGFTFHGTAEDAIEAVRALLS